MSVFAPIRRRSPRPILALALLVYVFGCIPKDPVDTSERVIGGTLRVGISESSPWVEDDAEPCGIEIALVKAIAETVGATVAWERGSEGALFRKLEHWELDLVVCGMREDDPWGKQVGMTRPYITVWRAREKEAQVWAVPPGENAWLMHVERFLRAHRAEARRMWEEAQ